MRTPSLEWVLRMAQAGGRDEVVGSSRVWILVQKEGRIGDTTANAYLFEASFSGIEALAFVPTLAPPHLRDIIIAFLSIN